jgi:hypothetical protein
MARLAFRALLLSFCMAAFCASISAQTEKTITIRMLDSKSGKLISTSDFLVRINHEKTAHGNWVQKNEEGVGVMKLPPEATDILVNATYDGAMSVYDNCDAAKDAGTADHAATLDHWYAVSDILTKGVVAPNGCVGKKVPDKLQVFAKPGEFVFFVRHKSPFEQLHE